MSGTARKSAIAILLVLTVGLIGLSIFVGYKLNQTQDVSVAIGCCGPILCTDGREAGADANSPQESCLERAEQFCGAGQVQNYNPGFQCTPGSGDGATGGGCNVRATNSSVIVENCGSQQFDLLTFTRRMTGSTDNCFVNQSNADNNNTQRVGNGTYTPSASKCFCQQIDIEFSGTKGAKVSGGWDASCEGTTAVTTFNCSANFQCVAVNNNSGTYKTRGSCETACVEPEALCGEDCTEDSQCPNDHSCSADGQCVLDLCAEDPTLCANDQCTPKVECGETCTANDQCPNDHTCSSGTCTLTSCVGNANCTNNGCTLPDTAFGDKPYHYISVGLLFLLSGFMISKYGLVNKYTLKLLTFSKSSRTNQPNKFSKDRKKFENRFEV